MRIGIDTGGTFTDLVALGDDGALQILKVASTPEDPARALLDAVQKFVRGAEVVHSTTVATNALLQRRGGPTALVCTKGFEDLIELRRQARPQLYALHPVVPPPLVDVRVGLDERMDASGRAIKVPSAADLDAVVSAIIAVDGIRSVAVAFLHAHLNGTHERMIAEKLRVAGFAVSISSEVLPREREYERTSTTLIDAYLQPVVRPYLERLRAAIGDLQVMGSNGGTTGVDEAIRHSVRTVLSGPAAGVVGARAVAKAAKIENVVTLDMGGTSTDIALLTGASLELEWTEETELDGNPIQLPMLAVKTIGAGGGSIARIDSGGVLKVGPQSAGASPGPAAYDQGGTLPTLTDAHVVVGHLDALLDGTFALDRERSRAAIQTIAERDRSVEETADGMIRVADAMMARAVKAISVERGRDLREYTLMPFGGAGGLHACAVARELGMRRVFVPPSPGLLCAYGALAAEVQHEILHSVAKDEDLLARFSALEAEASRRLAKENIAADRMRFERVATLRYRGQSFELAVSAKDSAPSSSSASSQLSAAFERAHRVRYGYTLDAPVELVTLRVRGSASRCHHCE